MYREEIRRELEGLSRQACVAFAARAALRTMPLMMIGLERKVKAGKPAFGGFHFWKKADQCKHLLATLRAQGVAVLAGLGEKIELEISDECRLGAHAATDDEEVYSYDDAAAAAAYAADAVYAAYDDDVADVAYAAEAAAAAYDTYDTDDAYIHAYRGRIISHFEMQINFDLKYLVSFDAIQLLATPIWSAFNEGIAHTSGHLASFKSWQNLYQLLQQSMLELDPGFAPWIDWFDQRVQGKPITAAEQRIWVDYPLEKAAQGPSALYSYLLPQFTQQAQMQLKRVRAMFIGDGFAGKTSLIRALHGEAVIDNEVMTQGVEIREWPDAGEGIITHCWDFGGQVMVRASHQFFLRSACLYVLLLTARAEKNATEEAEYWLQFVQSYGAGAPVLLVGNKYDENPVRLDFASLKAKYPNIIQFYDLACKDALGGKHQALFTRFKEAFCHQIQKMAQRQAKFTVPQFQVLQAVRELARQQSCLERSQFDALCDQQSILGQEKEEFLEFLDNLGVITHFAQIPFMADFVLDPRWLTFGVYALMYGERARLSEAQIAQILQQAKPLPNTLECFQYAGQQSQFIIEAMAQFKLCYRLSSEQRIWIIPSLLPSVLPPTIHQHGIEQSQALAYKMEFKQFVPRHLIPQLIVDRNQEIKDEVVWQYGVLLQDKLSQTLAWVQVKYAERTIFIWLQGPQAQDYLASLRRNFVQSLANLDLHREEFLRLPASALEEKAMRSVARNSEDWAPLRQLEAHWQMQSRSYISPLGMAYDLRKIFQLYLPKEREKGKEIHNHFHGDGMQVVQNPGRVKQQNLQIKDSEVNGNIVVAGKIKNSQISNQPTASAKLEEPASDPIAEQHLANLQACIAPLNGEIPNQQLQEILQELALLNTEIKRQPPRKAKLSASLSCLHEAAQEMEELGEALLDEVEQLQLHWQC